MERKCGVLVVVFVLFQHRANVTRYDERSGHQLINDRTIFRHPTKSYCKS